jgi:anaerobic magnesium-protoporphyrin IX monomethyl ester cyclase
MPTRILLLNPARHFIANKNGLGYLTPLGLVLLGGPLLDAGFDVKLINHDMNGWSMRRLLREIGEFHPKYVLLGHSGSRRHTMWRWKQPERSNAPFQIFE